MHPYENACVRHLELTEISHSGPITLVRVDLQEVYAYIVHPGQHWH